MNSQSTITRHFFKLCAAAALVIPLSSMAAGFWDRSYQPEQFFDDLTATQARYNAKHADAANNGVHLMEYAQAGITLSDVGCDIWLQSLGYADRNTGFFKDILNIVGNMILGVAGINGANPASLARGSVVLAAGNASIDGFRNEIILGTISDIESKLKEGRRTSAQYFIEHLPSSYDETKRRLSEYHDSCSPTAIKALLKTSLSAVKYVAPDTSLSSPIDQAKSDVLADTLYADMYGTGGIGSFSGDTLYKLYVTQIAMTGTTTSDLVSSMKNDPYITVVGKTFAEKNKDSRITILHKIAELRGYPAKLQADIQKEASQKAAKNVEKAQEEIVQAKAAVDEAQKKVADSEIAKSESGKEEVKTMSKLYSAHVSNFSSSSALNSLQSHANDMAKTFKSVETQNLQKTIANLAEKKQKLEIAKAAAQSVQANASAFGQSSGSITAVLVPANR